jgi:plastocyanin
MRVAPPRLAVLGLASLSLLRPAGGGSSGSSKAAPGHVDVKDNFFSPGTLQVSVGDTVTWDWKGGAAHNVTGPGFNSGTLSKGKTFAHTFNSAGTFKYVCTLHTGMKGTVEVS